jgi:hypothetical protein
MPLGGIMGIIKKGIFAFLLTILLQGNAFAARGFGPTMGVGTTDLVATNYTTAYTSSSSISFWAWVNGTGGSGLGRIISRGAISTSDSIGVNSSTSAMLARYIWSGTSGQFSWAVVANQWNHILIVYNGSVTTNVPKVYVNGVLLTVTTVVTPVGTYTPQAAAFDIGSDATGARYFDGKIAEVAYWSNSILAQAEATALFRGVSPLQIRPANLQFYAPIFGNGAETQWGLTASTQTITGTTFKTHPPVSLYPLFGF